MQSEKEKKTNKYYVIIVTIVFCALTITGILSAGFIKPTKLPESEIRDFEIAEAGPSVSIIGPANANIECIYSGAYAIPETVMLNRGLRYVTEISENAFKNCTNLKSVTIPSYIEKIGNNAFSGCTNLTSVYIEKSSSAAFNGTILGSNVFANTSPNLKIFTNNSVSTTAYKNAANWSTYAGKIETVLASSSTQQTVGNFIFTVNSAGRAEVYGGSATNINSANIPVTVVMTISENNYTLPVTTIKMDAFKSHTSIASAVIPSSISYIGHYAFQGCTSLASISISASVTSIGSDILRSCSSLSTISVNSSNLNYSSKGNAIYNKAGSSLIYGCKATVIPNDGTVKTIENSAFYQCTSLTSITIPPSVTTIGNLVFYQCTALTSINIPSSVSSIGANAFYYCSAITAMTADSTNLNFSSKGNAIYNKKGDTLMFGCKSTVIPNDGSVKTIGSNSFEYCTSLSSITIPSSVATIEARAFSGCTSLSSITIPSSVTYFGGIVFSGCSSLATVTMEGTTPPTLYNNIFSSTPSSLKIRVPSASLSAYQTADVWKTFADKIVGY